ncbi:MAG: DUF4258 domain-containing protein [Flavobacterium sp.]|nr:DUF4258 domain-containing protein [Candidatus Neoflavobacterium equi]
MKFTQRLAYYLFGLLFGGIFVYFLLNKKGTESFCYLPNCRVLKDIRNKPYHVSPEAQNTLKEGWVAQEDIKNSLEFGDVDFSKSNLPMENGKLYTIEGRNAANQDIIIEMINYKDKVVLKSVTKK